MNASHPYLRGVEPGEPFNLAAYSVTVAFMILDRNSDVVRIGPKMRGKVYVWQNGAWTLTGKVTLPEGWYAGPGPK